MSQKQKFRKNNPKNFSTTPLPLLFNSTVSLAAKGLYAILKDHAGKAQSCFPSVRTLAESCGVSKPYIRKLIKELEIAGAVVVQMQINPTRPGYHGVNKYWLLDMKSEEPVVSKPSEKNRDVDLSWVLKNAK